MARKYHQGKFKPRNVMKYRGDATDIVYRSSWERAAFRYLDDHPMCVAWGSEVIVVPYFSPVDGKQHRYFVDLIAKFEYPNGKSQVFLIEIKPAAQCEAPTTRNQKRLVEETSTYLVNQAKWEAATKFAKGKGWEFIVLTEKEIFGNTRRR